MQLRLVGKGEVGDPGAPAGNLFVTDTATSGVLRLDAATQQQTLLTSGVNLFVPRGIAIEEDGNLVVNFVFDITVVKAGGSGKYILKPQIAQSGPDQEFNEVAQQRNTERHTERHEERQGELNLEIMEGDIAPGDTVTLWVTFEDEDVAGATVKVNGQELEDLTGEDGTITFTIPEDADELEIEVKKGKLEGELRIEF